MGQTYLCSIATSAAGPFPKREGLDGENQEGEKSGLGGLYGRQLGKQDKRFWVGGGQASLWTKGL